MQKLNSLYKGKSQSYAIVSMRSTIIRETKAKQILDLYFTEKQANKYI